MNFVIISHAIHKVNGGEISAYEPYVREMNLWLKYVDRVTIVAPKINGIPSVIEAPYQHDNIKLEDVPEIQFTSIKTILNSVFLLPKIFYSIFKTCRNANHIHLRCPGNLGLLGCFVQILFPSKIKTAKYAGNWDKNSKQPLSYRLQKWILSNTFLTRNISVLVYGKWKNQSKNIIPFFTASFRELDKEKNIQRDYKQQLRFMFVGSLVPGKQPKLAIEIVESLIKSGINVCLKICGDGPLKEDLNAYVKNNNLEPYIILEGNKKVEAIKEGLKKSHFLILPSKSEGWPKVVAEAMFFGVIPIVTKISCVSYMLNDGDRGILIESDVELAVSKIIKVINSSNLVKMSKLASEWSQTFTIEYFESEIKKILSH